MQDPDTARSETSIAPRFRDAFGRIHDDLRISVTDRCNLRCTYCMPEEPLWYPRGEILSYEELLRLIRIAGSRGVRKFRLTGGEPLVRRDLTDFIGRLSKQPFVEDLSLTTNGLLLAEMAEPLARAGLRRVNVSLDTLQRKRFLKLTRRDGLPRVLAGLEAARDAGLTPIKLNTVLLPDANEDEVEALVEQSRENGWEPRFIEFMPLENGGTWDRSRVVSGEQVRRRIHRVWPLRIASQRDPHAPAVRYEFEDGKGSVAFIDSVTRPFCGDCSRLRLTSDGPFRACLYDDQGIDLKGPMRAGATDDELVALMERAVHAKGRGGALDVLQSEYAPQMTRTMHQIGG